MFVVVDTNGSADLENWRVLKPVDTHKAALIGIQDDVAKAWTCAIDQEATDVLKHPDKFAGTYLVCEVLETLHPIPYGRTRCDTPKIRLVPAL